LSDVTNTYLWRAVAWTVRDVKGKRRQRLSPDNPSYNHDKGAGKVFPLRTTTISPSKFLKLLTDEQQTVNGFYRTIYTTQ
jgi:hypothetical protein